MIHIYEKSEGTSLIYDVDHNIWLKKNRSLISKFDLVLSKSYSHIIDFDNDAILYFKSKAIRFIHFISNDKLTLTHYSTNNYTDDSDNKQLANKIGCFYRYPIYKIHADIDTLTIDTLRNKHGLQVFTDKSYLLKDSYTNKFKKLNWNAYNRFVPNDTLSIFIKDFLSFADKISMNYRIKKSDSIDDIAISIVCMVFLEYIEYRKEFMSTLSLDFHIPEYLSLNTSYIQEECMIHVLSDVRMRNAFRVIVSLCRKKCLYVGNDSLYSESDKNMLVRLQYRIYEIADSILLGNAIHRLT